MAASPPKKLKAATLKTDSRKPCPYGAVCYRKNPVHFQEFSHPGDKGHDDKSTAALSGTGIGGGGTPVGGTGLFGTSALSNPVLPVLPPCKYGAHCFRRNLLHFAEFSHPMMGTVATTSTTVDEDADSDTDVCDSDSEDKTSTTTRDGKDVLKRGLSLVKSYSRMTEEEQKELIHKAFAAKETLKRELEVTKKEVEEKDKQLMTVSEELKTGILLVDGEREALEGQDTVYFTLAAERQYKEGSADQIHYRLAESQFYRLLSNHAAAGVRVTKVEYVVSPPLVKRFREAQKKLKKTRGEEWSSPVLGFHGTLENNIQPICETGFRVPGEDGFTHRCDTGFYGAGVYFSEYTSYSMGYIAGCTKLLLCQVLPGKTYQCTKLIMGAKLKAGYDSHMSPSKKELVIFSSRHILPCYIVHYTQVVGKGVFTYRKARQSKRRRKSAAGVTGLGSPMMAGMGNIFTKRMMANNATPTKALTGKAFRYAGAAEEGKNFFKLISQHGGKKGTTAKFDVLVAIPGVSEDCPLVVKALEKDLPVVTEEFVYESILQKKFLDPDYYLHAMYDQ